MSTYECNSREELLDALCALREGDCVRIGSFSAVASSASDMMSAIVTIGERGASLVVLDPALDTAKADSKAFFSLCRALCVLDKLSRSQRRREGIDRAKEEGKYRGRKPITIDEELFDTVVQHWRSGEITARQAMARLDLKPNTFYRRIKEREELKMKDYKKVEQEIRSELKEAAKQSRHELGELKKQVRAEAKELKKSADEKLELHDVELQIRKDRIRAEAEHIDSVRQMKKDVEAESRELKKMLEEN